MLAVVIIIIFFIWMFIKINRIENMLIIMEKRLDNENIEKEVIEEKIIEKEKPIPIIQEEKEIIHQEAKEDKVQTPSFLDNLKEKYRDISIEKLLFENIILKIGVVAFILGIGLFLKYSIDKDWIPIWGRALIGVAIGIFMLLGGVKFINNPNRLFSEGLFGGGIAILYLSIFAGFALDGFKFLPFIYAFISMIIITILAGVISIKFNAKSTAIFGLIGGFLTPFLINSGSENIIGLLEYMLVLNIGVLYISVYKKWSLLAWMAFIITSLTELISSIHMNNQFIPMVLLFSAFFIIYTVVPFINEIKEKKESLKISFLMLFEANFIVALGSFYLLFKDFNIDIKYLSIVTIILALYLLIYASILGTKKLFLKNLFYVVLAQSVALLLFTPALIFTGASLTIIWAVESLMLLWIANKSSEPTYAFFALLGFAITIFRYLFIDIFDSMRFQNHLFNFSRDEIWLHVKDFGITTLFVLSSLYIGYKIINKTDLNLRKISMKFVEYRLFLGSFIFAFIALNLISHSLLYGEYYLFSFIISIGLFFMLLYKSQYQRESTILFYALLALLFISFINIIAEASSYNILFTSIKFALIAIVFLYIHSLLFKSFTYGFKSYKIGDILLSIGVVMLFLFLNIEVYNIVFLIRPEAVKFAITTLWIIFGISMFVTGIIKNIKVAKIAGTVLIFVAILKAFLSDLAKLDALYKIILFTMLGVLLFGLSYFYQSKTREVKE